MSSARGNAGDDDHLSTLKKLKVSTLDNDPVDIKKIKLKDLNDFARNALNDPAFREVAPISLLRAESQSQNPQGEPDDIALLVALIGNRCVGYHGLLPGLLKNKNRVSKVYWLVTFYLDPGHRGKGYGGQLVREIQYTNVDLVTTGITQAAAGVYRSAGFQHLAELSYCRLRSENTELLANAFQNLKYSKKGFTAKPVKQFARNLEAANTRQDAISFQRDIKMINWMIRSPWLVSEPNAQEDVKHYYFSRVRDLFEFLPLEIFAPDGKSFKGFLVLSISRKKDKTTIKVLDFYFDDPEDIYIAGVLTLEYAQKYQAVRLDLPMDLQVFLEDQAGLSQILKRKKRLYLFCPGSPDSSLARLAPQIKLNYCDSDTPFT